MGYVPISKNGKTRMVFAPTPKHKSDLRAALPALHVLQEFVCDPEIVHGFYRNRSPVTNAKRHVGKYAASVCFDLKDFFPTVTAEKFCKAVDGMDGMPMALRTFKMQFPVKMFINPGSKSPCELDDSSKRSKGIIAEQGLPTSPLLANIAFAPVDAVIKAKLTALCGQFGVEFVYTRYADDLTISVLDAAHVPAILALIPEIVNDFQFIINEKKTKVLWAKQGRRVITGVSVGETDVRAPRSVRRKLRAATHNKWVRKAKGLREFCLLKEPDGERMGEQLYRYVARCLRMKVESENMLIRMNKMLAMVESVANAIGRREQAGPMIDAIKRCQAMLAVVGT